MARAKEEEQQLTFPLDLGIDNTSLAQTVQPPMLVGSVNTRLSITRGVPTKAPHYTTITNGDTSGGACLGIVPAGGTESSLTFCMPQEVCQRIANGIAGDLTEPGPVFDGFEVVYPVPAQVARAGALPGYGAYSTPAVAYDSVNDCTWVAIISRYSTSSSAIYVSALSSTGEILAQQKLVTYTSGTAPNTAFPFVGFTSHGINGVRLWYRDSSSLAIKIREISLAAAHVVTIGAATTIYTPSECGTGQASVVSGGDDYAYIAMLYSGSTTAITVYKVNIEALSSTGITKTSFIATGQKLDIAYYNGQVLVTVAAAASGTNAILLNGSTMTETWSYTAHLAGSWSPTEVAGGFLLYGGVSYAIVAMTDSAGSLTTPAAAGTWIALRSLSTGASVTGYEMPWIRPTTKISQLTFSSGESYPLITTQRHYDTSPAVTDEEYITDPSIETYLLGYLAAGMVGRFGVDEVITEDTGDGIFSNTSYAYGSKYFLPYRVRVDPVDRLAYPLRYVELDFATHQPRYATTPEGSTLVAGAMTLTWDGTTLTEPLPMYRPTIHVTSSGGTATALSTGTYRFSAVHSWQDTNGVIHRSMPAAVREISGAGMQPTILAAKPVSMRGPRHDFPYTTTIYVSEPNGTVLYAQSSTLTLGSYFTYTDGWDGVAQPVVSVETPPIYSDGDPSQALMAQCPPASSDICLVGRRAWIISAERPSDLWASKEKEKGIAFEWSSDLIVRLDSTCGNAVALSELSGQLLVLTTTGVFILNGNGPNNLGLGQFSEPQKLSDLPCTSRASVISTPAGTMYISGKRFVKVGQGTAEIPNIDASLLGTVVTAILNREHQEVLFLGSSLTYVYNYSVDRWTTWTHLPAPEAACLAQSGLLLFSGNQLYQVDLSSVSTTSQMSWTTGDITFGNPQDDCVITDVIIHGRNLGTHGLTVTLTPDYAQGQTVTKTFSTTDIASATSNGQYSLSCLVGTHSMRALKIGIQETGASGVGASPTSVTVLITKNPGTKRDAIKPSGRK